MQRRMGGFLRVVLFFVLFSGLISHQGFFAPSLSGINNSAAQEFEETPDSIGGPCKKEYIVKRRGGPNSSLYRLECDASNAKVNFDIRFQGSVKTEVSWYSPGVDAFDVVSIQLEGHGKITPDAYGNYFGNRVSNTGSMSVQTEGTVPADKKLAFVIRLGQCNNYGLTKQCEAKGKIILGTSTP